MDICYSVRAAKSALCLSLSTLVHKYTNVFVFLFILTDYGILAVLEVGQMPRQSPYQIVLSAAEFREIRQLGRRSIRYRIFKSFEPV